MISIRLALAALFVPFSAHAAGWSTAERSVTAMATGGAGAARSDDPGANTYNAAAGLFLPGLSASAGIMVAAPILNASAEGLDEGARGVSTPPLLHLRWAGESFGLGASFSVPFGSQVVWPKTWAGRFELQEARLQVLRTEAFAGGHIGPVSFAVGPFLDIARLSFVRAIDFVDAEGTTSIETTAKGFGAQASVFVRALDSLDFGLSYQSRSKLRFSGWADFSVPPEFSQKAADQRLHTELMLPDRFRFGALYRISEDLELLADLELVLWSTVDELALDFEAEATTDQIQRRDWKTTVAPRIGAAWRAIDFLTLRAGFFVDPSPVPKSTVGPSSPDSTRVGLTLGAGADIYAGFGVDVGYQLLIFTGAESESGEMAGVRYGGTAHLFGAALRLAL
jgi:long-chain fatty acid transport protein